MVATADPGTLPGKATWYLATNLPRPGGPREAGSPHPAASLAEVTRIYGIRHWIEQSCKQVKDDLGWADFQVRSGAAIRRHQALVNCAFSFCWAAWFGEHPPQQDAAAPPQPGSGRGERGPARRPADTVLAAGAVAINFQPRCPPSADAGAVSGCGSGPGCAGAGSAAEPVPGHRDTVFGRCAVPAAIVIPQSVISRFPAQRPGGRGTRRAVPTCSCGYAGPRGPRY